MNNAIDSYIKYYSNLSYPPGYSILLRGKWGSGKTYYIKKTLSTENEKKFIYISLYGVNSIRDIDEKIFTAIHPVLGSKGMKIASGIFQKIIKATVRIDINGDDKDDISISSGLPEIDIIENYKKNKDKILIFDDLERIDMKLNSVLGYINNLVENDDRKVIILANEDEILNGEGRDDYNRIREKLVGKTFTITQNIDEAFQAFIELIGEVEFKGIIGEVKPIIKNVYLSSEYENLRHLKRSLENFALFLKIFPTKYLMNKDFQSHLIKLFFIISIEIESGSINTTDIKRIFPWRAQIAEVEKDSPYFRELTRKYPILDRIAHPIGIDSWTTFFKYATFSVKTIDKEIKASAYFIDKFTPAWERLWHFYKLEDDEFEKHCSSVYSKLTKKDIENQFVLTHIIGVLIQLNIRGLFNISIDEIIRLGKVNVDHLFDQNKLVEHSYLGHLGDVSYSKQYQSLENRQFQVFYTYLKDKVNFSKSIRNTDLANELIGKLIISHSDFLDSIIPNVGDQSNYLHEPILSYIDPVTFVEELFKTSNSNIIKYNYNFVKRYSNSYYLSNLELEEKWLANVRKLISDKLADFEPKLKKIHLEEFIQKIELCIDSIRNHAANNAPTPLS